MMTWNGMGWDHERALDTVNNRISLSDFSILKLFSWTQQAHGNGMNNECQDQSMI